jgi:hypothetical protein
MEPGSGLFLDCFRRELAHQLVLDYQSDYQIIVGFSWNSQDRIGQE